MGGPPARGPDDSGPLVDKVRWYRADTALARFRQTSHGHDAVIAILGRNGNQTPQEPGADQSRGTGPLARRFWHVAGETCRVPGEEGAGQEARDDRGDARLQASDPWRAGWTCRRRNPRHRPRTVRPVGPGARSQRSHGIRAALALLVYLRADRAPRGAHGDGSGDHAAAARDQRGRADRGRHSPASTLRSRRAPRSRRGVSMVRGRGARSGPALTRQPRRRRDPAGQPITRDGREAWPGPPRGAALHLRRGRPAVRRTTVGVGAGG